MLGYLRRGSWGNIGLLPVLGYLRGRRGWAIIGLLSMLGYLRREGGWVGSVSSRCSGMSPRSPPER